MVKPAVACYKPGQKRPLQGRGFPLVGGAYFLGLLWVWVTRSTGNFRTAAFAHILINPFALTGLFVNNASTLGHTLKLAGTKRCVYYVKDNGIGVVPEYRERIFGLFNKLDARSEGTGIGLALVKWIIEYHGGRIWVESELGKGATFSFTLPMSKVE